MLRSQDHEKEKKNIKPNIVLPSTYGNQPRIKYLQINGPH